LSHALRPYIEKGGQDTFVLLHQLVRANKGEVASVRLPFSWREKAANISCPSRCCGSSHIRLVALDGALEAGLARWSTGLVGQIAAGDDGGAILLNWTSS